MLPSQPLIIILSINLEVIDVFRRELLDRRFDRVHTLTGGTHGFGRVVGVAASSIPVAFEGLGVERRLASEGSVVRQIGKKDKLIIKEEEETGRISQDISANLTCLP